MAIYEIRDKETGRVLEVEGDGPPSDQDADELFASYNDSHKDPGLKMPEQPVFGGGDEFRPSWETSQLGGVETGSPVEFDIPKGGQIFDPIQSPVPTEKDTIASLEARHGVLRPSTTSEILESKLEPLRSNPLTELLVGESPQKMGQEPGGGIIGLPGAILGRAGKVGAAAIGDVMSAAAGVPDLSESGIPTRGNLEAVLRKDPEEQLPIRNAIELTKQQEISEGSKWAPRSLGASATIGGVEILPKIYGMRGAGAGKLAQSAAGALLFGFDDKGEFHVREAAGGAAFPFGSALANRVSAKIVGAGLASKLAPVATKEVVQKSIQIGAHQSAANAILLAQQSPELAHLYATDKDEFDRTVAEMFLTNFAFAVPEARGRSMRNNPHLMGEMLKFLDKAPESVKESGGTAVMADGSIRLLTKPQAMLVDQVRKIIADQKGAPKGSVEVRWDPQEAIEGKSASYDPVTKKSYVNAASLAWDGVTLGGRWAKAKVRHEFGAHARLDNDFGRKLISFVTDNITPEDTAYLLSKGYDPLALDKAGMAEELIANYRETNPGRLRQITDQLGVATGSDAQAAARKVVEILKRREASGREYANDVKRSAFIDESARMDLSRITIAARKAIADRAQAAADRVRSDQADMDASRVAVANGIVDNRSRIGDQNISFEGNDIVPGAATTPAQRDLGPGKLTPEPAPTAREIALNRAEKYSLKTDEERMNFARSIAKMAPEEFTTKAAGFNRDNIELGLRATPDQLKELITLRDQANAEVSAAKAKALETKSDADLNAYAQAASKPQFFNEAIELAEMMQNGDLRYDSTMNGKHQFTDNKTGSSFMVPEMAKASEIMAKAEKMRQAFEEDRPESETQSVVATRIIKNNDAYKELLESTGGGPFDGGCVTAAMALQKIYGGEIVALTRDGTAEHAVLKVGDTYIDAGGADTLGGITKRFSDRENVKIDGSRPLRSDDLPDAPRVESSAEKIASIINSPTPKVASNSLFEAVKANPDGFTVDPSTGEKKTTGYAVAPSNLTEAKLKPGEFTRESLGDYIDKFRDIFEKYPEEAFLGGWRKSDTGEMVLDVSFVFDNVKDALYVAKNGKQEAIFHLDEFNEINTQRGIEERSKSGDWDNAERPELRAIQEQLDSIIRGQGDARYSRRKADEPDDLYWWKQPARDENGENREGPQRRAGQDRAVNVKPLPGQSEDGFVPLTHWSRFDLSGQSIDPKKYGTGYAGEEKTRRTDYPKDWLNRSYFGLKGYSRESGLGKFKHTVEVPAQKLYDIEADPLNLEAKADEIAAKKYGRYDEKGAATILERLIKESGFSGYFSRYHKIAASFKAVPSSGRFEKYSIEPDREARRIMGRAAASKRTALDYISGSNVEPVKPPQADVDALELSGDSQKKASFSPVKAIANLLSTRTIERSGGVLRGDRPGDSAELGRAIADEVEYAISKNSKAIGWYDSQMKEAWKWIEKKYPELNGDSGKKSLYTALLAITSNGQDVTSNFQRASELYDGYRKTGKIEVGSDWGGVNADAINTGLLMLQRLTEKLGEKGLKKFLESEFTVGEMRKAGLKISGELADYKAQGSLVFGPKVGGGFYQNLSGNFTPVTMDRWFMRTINRMRGTLTEPSSKAMPKQIAEFYRRLPANEKAKYREDARRIMSAIKAGMFNFYAEKANPSPILKLAADTHKEFAKGRGGRSFWPRTKLNMASKNLAENMFGMNEAPETSTERAFLRESVNSAQETLRKRGINIENADLQAVLWYLEKDFYAKLGAKNKRSDGISYADAARRINEQQGDLFNGLGGAGDLRAGEPSAPTVAGGTKSGGRISPKAALTAAGEAIGNISINEKYSLNRTKNQIDKKLRDVWRGNVVFEKPPTPLPKMSDEAFDAMRSLVHSEPIKAQGMTIFFNNPDPATARKRGLRDNDPLARAIHATTKKDRVERDFNKLRFANMVPNTIKQADYVLEMDRDVSGSGQKQTGFLKGYVRNGENAFHLVEVDGNGGFVTQYSWPAAEQANERVLRSTAKNVGRKFSPQSQQTGDVQPEAGAGQIQQAERPPTDAGRLTPTRELPPTQQGGEPPQGQRDVKPGQGSSQGVKYSLSKVQKVFEQEKKKWPSPLTVGSDAVESFRTGVASRFRPIDKMADDIAKTYGGTSKRSAHIFEQIKGSSGKAEADVHRFDRDVTNKLKGDYIDFNSYVFAKRGLDRLQKDVATGEARRKVGDFTEAELQNALTELQAKHGPAKMAEFDAIAQEYQKHLDTALRLQVESGRMAQEVYSAIKSGNQFYAPFKLTKYAEMTSRPEGTGARIDTTADYTKAMKGIEDSSFKLSDMLAAARQSIVTSRILAEKNFAMRKVSDLAAIDTNHTFIKKLAPKEEAPAGMESVNIYEMGVKNRYAVRPEVAQALQIYQGEAQTLAVKMLAAAAMPFRAGATSLNLQFQIFNLLADVPRATLISKYGIRHWADPVMYPLDMVHSMFASMMGDVVGFDSKSTAMARKVPGVRKAIDSAEKLFYDFMDSGAAGVTVQEYLTPGSLRYRADTLPGSAKRFGKSLLYTIPNFAAAIEQTSKVLGIKRAMRFEGATSGADLARRIPEAVTEIRRYSGSPDFGRQGKWVEQSRLNLMFMFLNARIQGTTADVSRLLGADGAKRSAITWFRLAAAVGIPSILAYLLNNSDEFKDDYAKIPDKEKSNYWHIPKDTFITTDDGDRIRDYWRIPKRESSKWVANLTEAALDYADKREPEKLKQFGMTMLQELTPVNIQGDTAQERLESVGASLNPALKWPIEVMTGRDMYRHRNIVPDKMKDAAPEEQYKDRTPEFFVQAAEKMPDIAPEFMRSPLMIEHAFKTMTAGLITQFLPRKPVEGRSKIENFPLLSRFQAAPYTEDKELDKQVKELKREGATESVIDRRVIDRAMDATKGVNLNDFIRRVASDYRAVGTPDEKLLKSAVDLWIAKKNGITYQEQQIISLPVEQRAKYVKETLAKAPIEQRREILVDLVKKRILTDQVAEAIANGP